MKDLLITHPDPGDAQQICELYGATWLATYPNEKYGITTADLQEKLKEMTSPERVARFENYILLVKLNAARYFRVAKIGKQVVGVCGAVDMGDTVYIASLYVLPDQQGVGVGSRLMDSLLEWIGSNKSVKLHVVTYNQKAISFYEKWGFSATGKRLTTARHTMPSGNSLPEIEMERNSKE